LTGRFRFLHGKKLFCLAGRDSAPSQIRQNPSKNMCKYWTVPISVRNLYNCAGFVQALTKSCIKSVHIRNESRRRFCKTFQNPPAFHAWSAASGHAAATVAGSGDACGRRPENRRKSMPLRFPYARRPPCLPAFEAFPQGNISCGGLPA
jgi:hypothetical protein